MNSWSSYNRIRQQKICCEKGEKGEKGDQGLQGDVGPEGPSGLDISGDFYSDYLYWNDSSGSWQVGSTEVHIGKKAGETVQGTNSIAIGHLAGENSQGANSIAIGNQAGEDNQGANAIAIGNKAGQTNQQDKSIILNASDVSLNAITEGLFIDPIRKETTYFPLFYNNETKEVTRGLLFGLQQFTIFKSFQNISDLSNNINNQALTLTDDSNVVMGDSIKLLQYSIETNLNIPLNTNPSTSFEIEISNESQAQSLINNILFSTLITPSTGNYNFSKGSERDGQQLGISASLDNDNDTISRILVKLNNIETSDITNFSTLSDSGSDIYFRINLLCKLTYNKTSN